MAPGFGDECGDELHGGRDVGVVDALAELGFDGEDAALRLDDEVDLVASAGTLSGSGGCARRYPTRSRR